MGLSTVWATNMAHHFSKISCVVRDLSRVELTDELNITCLPTRTSGHSWVNTASGGMSIGHKRMMHGAKALAFTAAALFSDNVVLKEVRLNLKNKWQGRPTLR